MFQDLINEALETGRPYIKEGEVATYIPELGRADKNKLGISIFCRDGSRFSCGDTKDRFSIQSISKVISLAVALEVCGFDMVFENVGMEPSGDAFNSLIKLEGSNSHPYNPMINSGAIAVASFIEPKVSFEEMLKLARCFCQDDGIVLDEKVYGSEMSTVARNRAIAYLLESKGVINGNVEEALDFYVKMCSLSVTAESLAGLGLLLANDGVDPSGKRLLNSDTVRVVKTIMLTCGMYDGSGEFAVRVGIPSKSGVGGGLLYLSGSGKFIEVVDVLPAEGFNGIPVALLGLSNPIGVLFAGLFIAYLNVGGNAMQQFGFIPQIVDIIISCIIYCSALSLMIKVWLSKRRKTKELGTAKKEGE